MNKLRICGRTRAAAFAVALLLAGCGGSGGNSGSTGPVALSPMATVGKALFFDTSLSVSGQQSCGTCHDPNFAFAASDGRSVPLGGPNMDQPGLRNAQSLMYAGYIPDFFFDSGGAPNGGFFRDGRAKTLADQATQPFVTPFEMANANAAEVVLRLQGRPYLPQFTDVFGASALDDPDTALQNIGQAIAAFEKEDPQFSPFSSKYDFYTRGQVQLTPLELQGLQAFNGATRGDCAACHPSISGDGVTPAMFTDFSFDNLGIPRNADIPANSDVVADPNAPTDSDDGVHRYYDLGACGPLVNYGGNTTGLCGQFKVPTLRNIALTAPYFHNGEFKTLQDAVGFYVRRDTNPDQWYPTAADGTVTKFDDLPALFGGQFVVNINDPTSDFGYIGNVNNQEVPYNRRLGNAPALSPDEVTAVVAFLCTLTDGYDPANPSAYQYPVQCPQHTSPSPQ